jgi:hypothetical protein
MQHCKMENLDQNVLIKYEESLKRLRMRTKVIDKDARDMLLAKDEEFDNILIQDPNSANKMRQEIKK